MIVIENLRVRSDQGLLVHRIGTDAYGKAMTCRDGDSVANYEEVDTIPDTLSERERAELVERYIRERYTLSDELAILRQRDSKPQEFEEYNTYAEACKERASQYKRTEE